MHKKLFQNKLKLLLTLPNIAKSEGWENIFHILGILFAHYISAVVQNELRYTQYRQEYSDPNHVFHKLEVYHYSWTIMFEFGLSVLAWAAMISHARTTYRVSFVCRMAI